MLRLRVASAAVIAPVLLLLLIVGQPWLTIAIGLGVLIAARETFRLLDGAGYRGQPAVGAVICLAVVLEASLLPDRPAAAPAVLGLAVVAGAVWAFRRLDPRTGFRVWLATVFGAVYASLFVFLIRILGSAPELAAGAPLAGWLDGGRAWLLLLALTVWAYDTGAYAAGRTLGRGRFLAHISPSKTWSGVAGGMVAAVAASALSLHAVGGPPIAAVVLGPVIGATAQAGDLAESMLKRAAGAKDSGTLVPGHGGLLDRVDSFLFAAPALYLYLLVVADAA
ncbi:MAG: phosphatidate cytidylyltransferase [Chloroflexi bacterium]|nr:phosphatidate cytidylyltransferase [Chloroflexota bacterium]